MSARFTPVETGFHGPILLERRRFADKRGYLTRLFDMADLAPFGWDGSVAQVNESATIKAGTVRGMHFQHPPHAELKLVTCIAGRILDVAVDLRAGSPTFLKAMAVELSAENGRSFLIPRGFAHGFQALTDDVRMIYVHSEAHHPEAEGGLHPQDPALAIAWPLPVRGLSPRDAAHPPLGSDFRGVEP
jgi:dTDP-4-dehydrorhamnose 3,5-epimerase